MPALFSLQEIAEAFGLRPKDEVPVVEEKKPEPELAPVQETQQGGEAPVLTSAEAVPPVPAKESVIPPVTATTSPSTIEELLAQPRETRDVDTLRKLVEAKYGVRS